jgi:hypothetical protein
MAIEQDSSKPGLNRPLFVTIPEAQGRFGGSEGWYRKVVYRRDIPFYKRGGRVVFALADLEAYFVSRRVPARTEAAQ